MDQRAKTLQSCGRCLHDQVTRLVISTESSFKPNAYLSFVHVTMGESMIETFVAFSSVANGARAWYGGDQWNMILLEAGKGAIAGLAANLIYC
jgi:hypothetical protein